MSKRGDAKLVGALVEGMTIQMAAEKAGLSEATVYRRLQDPGFRAEIGKARREFIEIIVSRLVRTSTLASVELEKVIRDGENSTSDRLKAMKLALTEGGRWMDRGDLDDRIANLEDRLDGMETQA